MFKCKRNVGDKVMVRSDLSAALGASDEMVKNFAGKVVTISEVDAMTPFGKLPGSYHIEEDTEPNLIQYVWYDDMFEDVKEDSKEETEEETEEETKTPTTMPKLTTGMFGVEHDGEMFVVVGDYVVYRGGLCDDVEFIEKHHTVKALYNAKCFKQIERGDAELIWECPKGKCADVKTNDEFKKELREALEALAELFGEKSGDE